MKLTVIAICTATFLACLDVGASVNPKQVFESASQALKSGDYVAAESGFRQVLRAEPRNLGALGNLGVVYSRTHQYAKATETYQRALRVAPNDPGILLNLGLVYLKQDNYTQAIPFFRRLHTRDPANGQAINLLATCLVFGGKPQDALALLKPLAEGKPDATTLYLLGVAYARTGQVEAGKQAFDQMLSSSNTRSQASFLLGKAYYDARQFDEAAAAFQEVLHDDPAFPGVHREMGKVYVSLRRNDDAERELRLAAQQDPQDASAIYFLGGLLVQNGRYADGAAYLEQSNKMDPSSWATYMYLGKAKLKLNDRETAIHYLQKAVDLNAEEPSVFYLLASALRAAGRNEEARVALRRVSALHTTALDAEKRALEDAHVVGAR